MRFFYVSLLFFFVMSCGLIQSKQDKRFELLRSDYDHNNITIYKEINKIKCHVRFINDGSGNHFIVKQKRIFLDAHFRVITEMLAAYMANSLGIPSQHVRILPAGRSFPGKVLDKWPATIHSFVPGRQLCKLKSNCPYRSLYLKQSNTTKLSKEHRGLSRRVIANMSLHPDLPLILALDTFIGNIERHSANCFYDEKGDHFYAIDMDKIYSGSREKLNLCSRFACYQIKRMLKNESLEISVEEVEGLKIYQQTLIKLVKFFPPKIIMEKTHQFANLAGYNFQLPYFYRSIEDLLYKVRVVYKDVEELIILLDTLFARCSAV